ncbi:HlyD family secretion protein [Posidoniimonas corsicana]|nr:efflux RND transporter periplasmic adaptor subunit [Posidoniimonas corsicana]
MSQVTSSPGPDDDAVRRAKREIQGILQQITELSKSDSSPQQFYDSFLNKVVAALAASGGAVWTLSDAGVLQLAYQINLRETGLIENPIGQEQHGRLLTQVLQEPDGKLVAPHSGAAGGADTDEHGASNPTDFLLVMAPVHNDQGVQGIVEVFQRPGAGEATKRGYLRFLMQTCDLAGDYLRGRRLAHLSEKQSLWEQLESFTRSAHQTLDVTEAAFTIANEGRRLIGCDRVTVAVKHGSRVTLEAISGQDVFDKRSNTATLLTKVARAVCKTGEDVWFTGDGSGLAPQVEKAIDAYVDDSHTKNMAILPLVEPEDEDLPPEEKQRRKGPPKVLGALIVEQMVDSTVPEGYRQRVDVVRGHSVTAIGNALEHSGLFLMPVWKTLGRATSQFRGRALPKTATVLTLIAAAIAAGMLVQVDLKLQGDGRLVPVSQKPVFARIDGEVEELLVENGQPVQGGQPLMRLKSYQLDSELTDVLGKLEQARARWNSLARSNTDERQEKDEDRAKRYAERLQVDKEIKSLNVQLDILKKKQKLLEIVSPMAGQVVKWKLSDDFPPGRPVQQGATVMEIADPRGDWEVEVLMPEKKMGHVTRTWKESLANEEPMKVVFIPASKPEDEIEGVVQAVDQTSESRGEEGNVVKLTVAFDQAAFRELMPNPKIDAAVTANVYCGRRSFFYYWLHPLYDTIQREIVFRF